MNRFLLACALVLCGGAAQAQTTVEYLHTDALGSIVAVTDAGAQVIERREYAPFGEQLQPTVPAGPGYTGHVEDRLTGLTYMQQRYYDPAIGRFLSVDPVGPLSDPINHFGRYHYANNNPYKYTDPDGRAAWLAVGAGIGAVVGAGVELYSQSAGFSDFSNIDVSDVLVEGGRGAVVGLVAATGGALAGAMAVDVGAAAAVVAVAQAGGSAYGAGLATFATGPATDLAKGNETRSAESYGADAANAALGSVGGSAAGRLISGSAQRALGAGAGEVAEVVATEASAIAVEKLEAVQVDDLQR